MLHRCDVRDGEGWRGADRTDEARKRHENHGNRGSSWIAALGQHACRQSPRSSAGTAMLRLLHDRGQAGEFDRRSRLRQRSTRRGVAQGRHRDDRAASQQQKQAAHARSATASRYMRRWLVERLFAWIQWQRRILVRWEYYAHNFLGFVQLACLLVLFRRFNQYDEVDRNDQNSTDDEKEIELQKSPEEDQHWYETDER